MNWGDIEASQTEEIDDKLAIWKPQVISALINNTFLSPLHGKFATKAESLTSLNSLYFTTRTTKLILKLKK